MSNTDFVHSFVETLNYALAKDYDATSKVMRTKVPANKSLVTDSKIIVGGTEEEPMLSGLSLLNSMINTYCGKKIFAVINDKGNIERFEVEKDLEITTAKL